jgi:hypothetical protein
MYYAFYKNQFFNVTLNLMSIQAFKQVAMNVLEWGQGKFLTKRNIDKATNKYANNTATMESL